MAPQSRGSSVPPGFQSKSTPNLPSLGSLRTSSEDSVANPVSPTLNTSPSEQASIEDNDNFEHDHFTLNPSSSGESSEDDDFPLDDQAHGRPRSLYSHERSRSQSHLAPSTSGLFPPFYNRPPTPLPPSPSLTSLLRPSFSTQTSRPTTPDSSDVEGLNGTSTPTSTAAAVAKSARTATTVPRASPKVPTYEYYGFALYLASSAAFLMYLLWAYLPSPFLHQLGIYYYPNRWWALAVPAWLVVGVGYIYVALASYNTQYLTLPMQDIECLVDEAAQIAVIDQEGKIIRHNRGGRFDQKKRRYAGGGKHRRNDSGGGKVALPHMSESHNVDWKSVWSEGTDAVMDVPIGGVCEILYGQASDEDDADYPRD